MGHCAAHNVLACVCGTDQTGWAGVALRPELTAGPACGLQASIRWHQWHTALPIRWRGAGLPLPPRALFNAAAGGGQAAGAGGAGDDRRCHRMLWFTAVSSGQANDYHDFVKAALLFARDAAPSLVPVLLYCSKEDAPLARCACAGCSSSEGGCTGEDRGEAAGCRPSLMGRGGALVPMGVSARVAHPICKWAPHWAGCRGHLGLASDLPSQGQWAHRRWLALAVALRCTPC